MSEKYYIQASFSLGGPCPDRYALSNYVARLARTQLTSPATVVLNLTCTLLVNSTTLGQLAFVEGPTLYTFPQPMRVTERLIAASKKAPAATRASAL